MKTKFQRGIGAALTVGAVTVLATAPAMAGKPGTSEAMSPSTTTPPYVLPVAPGVRTKSMLTVGDNVDGYRMVGIPDGLGAYRNDGNRLTLLMNHELRDNQGVTRRHGQVGAFVSEWSIDRKTLEVTRGQDMIDPGIQYWDYLQSQYSLTPNGGGTRADGKVFQSFSPILSRFCSNTLSDPGQLFNEETGNGYTGQLFFPNEESGDRGRGFALTMDGQLYQLPRIGLFSWENTIPAHNQSDTTLVMGQEDGGDGQLWLYEGTKTNSGSAIDKAGLTNGANYVAAVAGAATDKEFRKFGKDNPQRFTLSEVGWDQEGGPQNAEAKADGISLNRVEDGAFDPSHPNDFYFLTTEGGKNADTPTNFYGRDGGGLWRMRFDDIENPQLGGTLTLLLDGSEAPHLNKPDNMTIDGDGNLLIQEDPGNNVSVARIVAYRIADGARGVVAQFDPKLFKWNGATLPTSGNPVLEPGQITFDEESSGIIDAHSTIGPRWFLLDAQVHKANPDPALVEEGQMLALHVDRWKDVYDIEG